MAVSWVIQDAVQYLGKVVPASRSYLTRIRPREARLYNTVIITALDARQYRVAAGLLAQMREWGISYEPITWGLALTVEVRRQGCYLQVSAFGRIFIVYFLGYNFLVL
jgi:hypothetical protein